MLASQRYNTELSKITQITLNSRSSTESLQSALDDFAGICADITAITPDATFNAWAEDSFLSGGVAINPQAAAYCIKDYQRTITFISAVNAAIEDAKNRFPATRIKILYAGCGPFATLLLPLLVKFEPEELDVYLLDIHQASLDSVQKLLGAFGLEQHNVNLIQGDACRYQHDDKLHIIVAEVMQKALEQEPQVAATANLAPQLCEQGIFIPEKIEVQLCLAHWDDEKALVSKNEKINADRLEQSGQRYPLGTLMTLQCSSVAELMSTAALNNDTLKMELKLLSSHLPDIPFIEQYDLLILTRIQVYARYFLSDYESEITLPHKCYEISPLGKGLPYQVCYQLGGYPRFYVATDWLSGT